MLHATLRRNKAGTPTTLPQSFVIVMSVLFQMSKDMPSKRRLTTDCIETIHIFVAGTYPCIPFSPLVFGPLCPLVTRPSTQLKQGDPGCSYERRRCGFSARGCRDFSGAWRIIPGRVSSGAFTMVIVSPLRIG